MGLGKSIPELGGLTPTGIKRWWDYRWEMVIDRSLRTVHLSGLRAGDLGLFVIDFSEGALRRNRTPSYRLIRAVPPPMTWRTSSRVIMLVSPRVLWRRAPWAAPNSTMSAGE